MKITAICGWAIPPVWFEQEVGHYFPGARVRGVYPKDPLDRKEADSILAADDSDLILGYSLGSLWLLQHQELLPAGSLKALLAPILAFPKEKARAGRTPIGKLKYMIRTLDRSDDPRRLVQEFFALGNLDIPVSALDHVPDRTVLRAGLEFLAEAVCCKPVPDDYIAILGVEDPFTDSAELQRYIPHLQILQGTGHATGRLLTALAHHPQVRGTLA